MNTADVMIAGAGIVGLSCALELSRRGLRVQVFERDRAMSAASWAAAGMLAAHDPENPPALLQLSRWSESLYPDYLARVGELSGQSIPFRTEEVLQTAHGYSAPPDAAWLSPEEASERVPQLETARLSFFALREWSLDPRDLCVALPAAARAAGVEIREEQPVESVRPQNSSVEFRAGKETLSAGAFVNCCGAWASDLPGCVPDLVKPRKGQMVVVKLSPPTELNVVLRSAEVYLVPRGDGRVVIGATVEHAGFDTAVDPQSEALLLKRAGELWPPILKSAVVARWAGLRPATDDELPLIGPAEEPRCFVATGHFRNGILLAPATARIIAALVLGEAPPLDIRPFALQRLGAIHLM